MAKRTWNPASNVNCNHVSGMLAKGTAEYHDWVARIFAAKAAGSTDFVGLVEEGQLSGFLTDDNTDTLLGTKNTATVQAAAQSDAKRSMVVSMLSSGLDSAVDTLIASGQVTAEFVAEIKAQITAVEATTETVTKRRNPKK